MRKALRTLVVVSAAMHIIILALSGCTRYANEQQLQALEETKAAAMSAEEALDDCKSETQELESQLSEAKQALEDMQEEKEAVSERLAAMGS